MLRLVSAIGFVTGFAAGFAAACSTGPERPDRTIPGAQSESVAETRADDTADAEDDSPPVAAGPPLTEAVARALLAKRFRAAGFRIRDDVRVRSESPTAALGDADPSFDLTVDGYDPEAKVGFEYIDPAEVGSDLLAEERAALGRENSGPRILILDPAPQSRILEQADEFLRSVAKE